MAAKAKAMILAAGLGTRLKPITLTKPKALAEVDGVPLLEYAIRHLKRDGFTDIVINIHHFGEQILEFLMKKNNFDINISISDESDQLLNTGGGLKKASWFFNNKKPFLLYNVDILSDIDLSALYNSHINSEALATLAVRGRKTSRYFLFNQNGLLCGWKNMSTNEIKITNHTISKLQPFAFSGIQVINSDFLEMLENYNGAFSITDVYLDLCANYKILSYNHDKSFWLDLGTVEKVEYAEKVLAANNFLLK
jgi:NDP-sugar pyrophosphorylase family protein